MNGAGRITMIKAIAVFLSQAVFLFPAFTQKENGILQPGAKVSVISDTMPGGPKEMDMSVMSHSLSLNLPMNRNGSGTSWQPDASPMYGYMVHAGKWMFMFHGNFFIRYNKQDIGEVGSRGGEKWDTPNMLMSMGQTRIGQNGLFLFNAMFSLDALTMGGYGYPLLFQTGESWQGKPLVDRQHPHDLFSELSFSYSHAFSRQSDLYIYLGYPGEPALGPVAFMHRLSAMDNPDAPIGHHWADATHITFGVATIGFRFGKLKLEASSFTGREPDENRYNFDQPKFDSWSGRLSFNPDDNWSLQVSHGFIRSPEALRPDENVNRTTASAAYLLSFATEKYFSSMALWGLNAQKNTDGSNNLLLENALRLDRFVGYLRIEWVQKSREELNLDESVYGTGTLFPLTAITLGAGYDLFRFGNLRIMGGGQLSLSHPDPRLTPLYGNNPISGEIYIRLYPGLM
jgi:hypothetical protein